jgi:large subunit ribosomal protein L25
MGDAEGVGRGGVLEQFLYTVSVEAKPADVPNSLEIDISALEIGDAAHVRDLTVPVGVVVVNDLDDVLAQISAPRVAEEGVPAEGEAAEGEGATGAEGGGGEGGGESAGGE